MGGFGNRKSAHEDDEDAYEGGYAGRKYGEKEEPKKESLYDQRIKHDRSCRRRWGSLYNKYGNL